jgi:hypothetical protein
VPGARLEWRPGGPAEVEILRTFGEPVVIERVVERDASGAERTIALGPTRLVAGTRLRLALGGSP